MTTLTPRCTAHNRFRQPCGQRPIIGGKVCVAHGGRAPHVRQAARERLLEFVDRALTELLRIATEGETDAVRLAACKDILDRAGYKAAERIEATVLPRFTLKIDRGDGDELGPIPVGKNGHVQP
jgi:hypothetical protein